MKIGVVGTGHTKFGKAQEDIGELMFKAVHEALENAGANIAEVDAVYISNFSSSFAKQGHLPALLAEKLGVRKRITRVESACASGGLALKEAALSVLSGINKIVLVVGVEKMTDTPIEETTQILATAASKIEMLHGTTFPSLYALMARRHFYEYGTTEEHLAVIAAKNHSNALHNPLAQFHKEITVQDVLNSKLIASPLKMLDCSPITDGAAAVLLCSEESVSRFTSGSSGPIVYLTGVGHCSDTISLLRRENLTSMPAVIEAAAQAYSMSGFTPQDINVAELHDCFTIAELIEIEDLGFCEKGKGKDLVESGATKIGGKIPINPSGGLKAKGHPVGATGVSQAVEIVKQLRGEAGKRQVENAKVGLCCNVGGSGATAIVSIFSR